jgi:hypothetical protein
VLQADDLEIGALQGDTGVSIERKMRVVLREIGHRARSDCRRTQHENPKSQG